MPGIVVIKILKHIWIEYIGKNRRYSQFLLISMYFNIFLLVPTLSQTDSLYSYLEIAAKNNPSVQQKFTEYLAALQKIPQVSGLPDPELSIGVFLQPMELVMGKQVADMRLMQMFPWFGVIKNARDEMSFMANAKLELFRDAKFQVFYDVQRTWYDLYKVKNEISVSEKNIEILEIIERLTLVRFKSAPVGRSASTSSSSGINSGSSQGSTSGSATGMQSMGGNPANAGSASSNRAGSSMETGSMGSLSSGSGLADLYRIQIEIGDLENNIANLRNRERTVIAQFNSYLNRSPVSKVFTDGIMLTDSLELSLLAVSDSILANNPMLSMLEFEKQSFEARKNMATRMGYPMIGLGLNYSPVSKNPMITSAMNGRDMIMPMVTITLPVYRKKYNALKTEADLLGAATSLSYQATTNSLQTEYYQAIQLYQDAQRRITLYENQYELASKSFDLILKSFSASSSGLTEVLRVRQQTLDYELKKVEAIVDYNKAIAWLKRLMANAQIQ